VLWTLNQRVGGSSPPLLTTFLRKNPDLAKRS
jgi:hypothetical protein